MKPDFLSDYSATFRVGATIFPGLYTVWRLSATFAQKPSDFRSDYDTQTSAQGTARDCAGTYAETAAELRGNLGETRERGGMAARMQRNHPGR